MQDNVKGQKMGKFEKQNKIYTLYFSNNTDRRRRTHDCKNNGFLINESSPSLAYNYIYNADAGPAGRVCPRLYTEPPTW